MPKEVSWFLRLCGIECGCRMLWKEEALMASEREKEREKERVKETREGQRRRRRRKEEDNG